MWKDKSQIKQIADQVFLVWKQLGQTPLERLEQVRDELGIGSDVPMTYAGRLDPAAEGELLILAGEACKRKPEFLGLDKTYQFQVLLGFKTDTLDLLGMVTNTGLYDVSYKKQDIKAVSNNLIGSHNWPYPAYSSQPVDSKPLWQWAREGEYQNLLDKKMVPLHEFKLYDISYKNSELTNADELIWYIELLTKKVSGDFRQVEILQKWQTTLEKCGHKEFQLLGFETTVSSGAYVRQIAQQIGSILGLPTTTFSIVRTKIHLDILIKK